MSENTCDIQRYKLSLYNKSTFQRCRTYGGVIRKKEESHVVVVPSLMWVKALDMILDKLRVCGVDFNKVAAVSGCAQVTAVFKIKLIILQICRRDKRKVCLFVHFNGTNSNMAQSIGAKAAGIGYNVWTR